MNTTTRENLEIALHASDNHTIDDIVAYQVRRTVDRDGNFLTGLSESITVVGTFTDTQYAMAREHAVAVESANFGYAVVEAIFADGCHEVI